MDITDMTPKKYAAAQAKRVLRVNKPAPIHLTPKASETLSARAKRIMGLTERETYAMPKPPGAAGPRNVPFSAELYDGAELRPFDGRRGAMDAFALPSRGI